jgi:hypothetical protein
MLYYLIVIIIFFYFLLFLLHLLNLYSLRILYKDLIFRSFITIALILQTIDLHFLSQGILISSWHLYFFLVSTALSKKCSRGSFDHRDYQFLAASLIED